LHIFLNCDRIKDGHTMAILDHNYCSILHIVAGSHRCGDRFLSPATRAEGGYCHHHGRPAVHQHLVVLSSRGIFFCSLDTSILKLCRLINQIIELGYKFERHVLSDKKWPTGSHFTWGRLFCMINTL